MTQKRDVSDQLQRVIERVCAIPCRVGQDLYDEAQKEIIHLICGAQFVLADVSEQNRNAWVEAGVALGAGRPLHLVAQLDERDERRTRFMFRHKEIGWYRNPAELMAIAFRVAKKYRRRVYAP